MPTKGEAQTLHERLGGVYPVTVVADDFIDRIMLDPGPNTNRAITKVRHKVPPTGFKYLVTEMTFEVHKQRRLTALDRKVDITLKGFFAF